MAVKVKCILIDYSTSIPAYSTSTMAIPAFTEINCKNRYTELNPSRCIESAAVENFDSQVYTIRNGCVDILFVKQQHISKKTNIN